MRVENRTFLLSGGSSGLGLATVKQLLNAGAYISVLDRVPLDLKSPKVLSFQLDITKVSELENAVEKTVAWTKETGAPLGGVINCAGIGGREKIVNANLEPFPAAVWDRVLAVNLSGTFHLIRLASKHLVTVTPEDTPDRERGVIIMTSSTSAEEGESGQVAYSASKGAVNSMTLPMARDFAVHGVRVVTISPAGFSTPMIHKFEEQVINNIVKNSVLYPKRLGKPDEYASTVMWALQCPYVNGETIRLSAGTRVTSNL